ncbi:MAG: VOC family protein [Verrucomicrobiota bacterium]
MQSRITPMSLLNLQRLVLNVSDPEAAADWYRQNLGLKDSESPSADARSVCLVNPRRVVLIDLWAESVGPCPRQQFRRGFQQHLTLQVDNPMHDVFRLLSVGAKDLRKSEAGLVLTDPFGLELVVTGQSVPSAA